MQHDNLGDLPTFFGDYVFQDEIGRGGMKIVARAYHVSTSNTVAVALLKARFPNQELRDRFFREARAIQSLSHPNIVKVFEQGTIDGQPYFVMEFVDGAPLSARLSQKGMTPADMLGMILPVCDAILHAHEHGVLHRDIKPGNILLDSDEVPKLIDFGLAKDLQDGVELTRAGQGIGTSTYVSPEQRRGERENVSIRSDIYSLGVTMLEMLLGTTAFVERLGNPLLLCTVEGRKLVFEQLETRLPLELLAICRKCTELAPEDRYQDVGSLMRELEALRSAGIPDLPDKDGTPLGGGPAQTRATPARLMPVQLGPRTVIAQRYTLKSRLPPSAMGEVWIADDPHRVNPVVIKFLPEVLRNRPEELQRLRRSFKLVESLQHGNICPVYDLAEDPVAGLFLVMKFVKGHDLSQLCLQRADPRNPNPFSLSEVCRILHPLAQAIDYAHGQGVLHRDIKPANIVLGADGDQPQLIDFGLAEEIRSTVTRIQPDSNPAGTLNYLAPEIWRNQGAGRESDQYALGVVAYEMLGGNPPFGAAGAASSEVLRQCVLNEPVPALQLPAAINEILKKVLDKDPKRRFPDCRSFVEALRRGRLEESGPAGPQPAARVWRPYAASLLAAAVIVLFAVTLVRERPPQKPENAVPRVDPVPKPSDQKDKEEHADLSTTSSKTTTPVNTPPDVKPPALPPPSPSPQEVAKKAYEEGIALQKKGDRKGAIHKFDEAVQSDDKYYDAYFARGFTKVRLGELDEALPDLEKALQIRPTSFEALLEVADVYRQIGFIRSNRQYLQTAVTCYTGALKIQKGDPRALLGRGIAYLQLQCAQDAIDDFTAVIDAGEASADVSKVEVIIWRGDAYHQITDNRAALEDYEKAFALDPTRTELGVKITELKKQQ